MTTGIENFNGTVGTAPAATLTGWADFSLNQAGSALPLLKATDVLEGSTAVACLAGTSVNKYFNMGTPVTTFYSRCYYKMTNAPAAYGVELATSQGTYDETQWLDSHGVGITPDLRLYATAGRHDYNIGSYNTGNGTYAQSAVCVPLYEWFRIDTIMTATTCEIRLYVASGSGGISSTGAAHYSVSSSSGYSTAWTQAISVGPSAYNVAAEAQAFVHPFNTLYMDGLAVSDTTIPAPLTLPITSTASVDIPFAVTAEGETSHPGAASLDVSVSVTAEGVAEHSATASVDVPFSVTADATVTAPAANDATVDVPFAIDAAATVSTPAPTSIEYWGILVSSGAAIAEPSNETYGDPNTYGALNTWWSTV